MISATSGDITSVTPGRTSAGSWKQKDLPNPAGSSPSTFRPCAAASMMASCEGLRSAGVSDKRSRPPMTAARSATSRPRVPAARCCPTSSPVMARARIRRVCGSSVCSSSASGVLSSAALSAVSRPCLARNDQMRAQPSAIGTTFPPVLSPVTGSGRRRPADPSAGGSSSTQERLPVGTSQSGVPGELAVADDDDAAVLLGPDQPPDGLPQLQRGQRQVVIPGGHRIRVVCPGRLGACLDRFPACLDNRRGERRERHLVDPHETQAPLIGDIDALPQAFRSDQEPAAVL